MFNLLINSIPMLISMIITQLIYNKYDNKYNFTKNISSKLPIKDEWKAVFFICCAMLSILIIGVIGIYIIALSDTLYAIIIGTIAGFVIETCDKLSKNKK